jgi:hypothetical protein
MTQSLDREEVKREFVNEIDLAEIYERSFNLDVCLLSISDRAQGIEDKITECICQTLLCDDEELAMLGLSIYIQETKPGLLLETEPYFMNFTYNKDVTLRSMVGPEKFARLINKTVEIIGNKDRINCILLLDKSK